MSKKTFTARTGDRELISHLENKEEANSAWIVEAMREKLSREIEREKVMGELTEDQQIAYRWLCNRLEHGGHINLEAVKNHMAKKSGTDMQLVEDQIIRPLDNKGYISVVARINDVVIKVNTESITSEKTGAMDQ